MVRRRTAARFDQKAVRNWTLYIVRMNDSCYYIGITSYKDFMRRINQHGGRLGARVNKGKTVDKIIEIHCLGKMSGERAGQIENDFMLEYRKRYGARRVRGGYEIYKKTSLIPTYTPGSTQSYIFIGLTLALSIALFVFIALQ